MMQRQRNSGIGLAINLGLYLLAVLALCVVVNYFAQRSGLREQWDATKTRAYSLTPQTEQLLASLQGDWTIAVTLDEQRADRAMRRQIDEVLRRYTDSAPRFSVLRIDPTNPRTLGNYEELLANLQRIYQEPIQQYDFALDDGLAAFRELQVFAVQQSSALEPVLRNLAENDPHREQLGQLALVLGRLADQGDVVLNEIAKARKTDDAHPIADYETARSILAQGLSDYATQLDEMGQLLARWQSDAATNAAVKQYAANSKQDYPRIAQRLAEAADPLKHLPPMELSSIGKQLATGEAAVILSPKRAAVIPSSQLFPKSNIQQRDDGGVKFDQRFRGEQLISATIRSLIVEHMPMVVFVHGEDKSLLWQRDNKVDLVGVAAMLQASRFEVKEWPVANRNAQRPESAPGQPVVWVIIPPPKRQGLEISQGERALIEASRLLIENGESVMLSLYPSLLQKYGQNDPWSALASLLGVTVDTSKVIFEQSRNAEGKKEKQRAITLQEFDSKHPVARAINGSQGYFSLPMTVNPASSASADLSIEPLITASPGSDRWLESNWSADPSTLEEPSDSQRFDHALPVAVAIKCSVLVPNPGGGEQRKQQRAIVIGSGGWMLSFVSDVVTTIGGGRVALVYPANHELMLAGVAWLSGMDELIAASPLSQEVPRLRDITPETRTFWFFVLVVGLPAMCIAMAIGVSMWRRR